MWEKYEVYFDFFFQIHGRIVQRHRVNEVLEPDQGEQLIEDVDALQSEAMDAGIGLLLELTQVYEERGSQCRGS